LNILSPDLGARVAEAGRGMSRARQTLGKIGEDLACKELERRGYAILTRRYRRRVGELDIVARDGGTLVFVEVKTRDSLEFGSGGEAITALKRRRMAVVADEYLVSHRLTGCACRFDVVAIDFQKGVPVIEIYMNAFGVA
jgi:putative endonuclease